MADRIHFQIATADGVVCDSMASYALIPLSDGDVGVLADHAPMIGALKEGVVKYVSEGTDHFAAISGGVLSVADNEVILLARTAERAAGAPARAIHALPSALFSLLSTLQCASVERGGMPRG